MSRDKITSQEPGDKICGNCVSQLVRPSTYDSFILVRSKNIYIYRKGKLPNFVTLQKCFFLLGKPQKLPFENKKYFTLKNLSTYYGHITLRFGLSVGTFTGLLQYLSKDIISLLQNPFPAILRPKKSPDCNSAQITFFCGSLLFLRFQCNRSFYI